MTPRGAGDRLLDAAGVPVLGAPGWPTAGDVEGIARLVRQGGAVELRNETGFVLPELPANVTADAAGAAGCVVVTDADPAVLLSDAARPTVVMTPPSLVVGVGCRRGTPAAELREHLHEVLRGHGLALAAVAALTSVDAKAGEAGLRELAAGMGVPLRTYPAELLDRQEVPAPSEAVSAAVGTRSVSEAAVLADGAALVVPKHAAARSTIAVGRVTSVGRGRGADGSRLAPLPEDRLPGNRLSGNENASTRAAPAAGGEGG